MSFRAQMRGVFRCDAPDCRERVDGYLDELPEGWTEWKVEEVDFLRHRCPKCSQPEIQA